MGPNIPNLNPEQLNALSQKVATMDDEGNVPSIKKDPLNEEDFSVQSKQPTLKEKIAQLERELNENSSSPAYRPESRDSRSFKDSMGNETYYVKNISGRQVLLSDLNINKIKIGESVDLLQFASLEQLRNSKDLRKILNGIGLDKEMERLSEEEYFNELMIARENKKKNDIMKRQEELRAAQPAQQQQERLPHERPFLPKERKIRPVIEAKLGKLALKRDPDPQNARLAMTSREFITWAQNEPMSHAEIEFVIGHPAVVDDHNIRVALLEKKNRTPVSED